jgi:putative Mg2+ transporter-C (MgtC) family protein
MAGLRTNALVSVGASMFVMLAMPVADNSIRIAAQVVSGIGFLGAGVIMREGLTIRGLNTAATLWCSAAVGSLSGVGETRLAMIGTGAVLLANFGLRPLARRIDRQPTESDASGEILYTLRLVCRSEAESHARALLLQMTQSLPIILQSLHSEDLNGTGKVQVLATFHSTGRQDAMLESVVGRLSLEPEVTAASWQVVNREEQ